LLLQARAAGLKSTFMSDDSCVDPEFIKAAGAQADGSFLTFAPDPEKAPSAKAFLEKYRARFGEPGPYCVYTYVAANVLLSAIQKTGATDGAQIADALRRDAFDTAMGQIQFDENGDITNDFYVMWTVRDGKFAPCE
jgi:branched-chain amino acid transport system substrate-binding protein